MSHQRFDCASLFHAHGFRVTPQRRLILDAVCEGGGHSTPDAIFERVRAKAPSIHRATVYRALDFLCEMRLVVAMRRGGHTLYEIAGATPHHHLICRNCNQMEDIDHPAMRSLLARIEREHEFSIDMDHIAFFGLCKPCRAQSSGSP